MGDSLPKIRYWRPLLWSAAAKAAKDTKLDAAVPAVISIFTHALIALGIWIVVGQIDEATVTQRSMAAALPLLSYPIAFVFRLILEPKVRAREAEKASAALKSELDDIRRAGTPTVPDMHFRDVANALAQEAGVPRLIAVQHLRDMFAYQAMRLWARGMSGDSPVQVPRSFWKGNVRFRGKDDYDSDIPDTGVVFLEGRIDGRWQSTHYEPMVLKADFEKVRPILLEKLKDWKSR